MKIEIRFAELSDVNEISRLSEQWGYASSLEKMRKCLEDIFSNRDHVLFVILYENQIAGWIHGIYSLRVESDPFVEIGGLIVDETFRRQGLGKQLINKMTEWSLLKNCHLVRVRCNIIREGAHTFYMRLGFKEIKQQKVYDIKIN